MSAHVNIYINSHEEQPRLEKVRVILPVIVVVATLAGTSVPVGALWLLLLLRMLSCRSLSPVGLKLGVPLVHLLLGS